MIYLYNPSTDLALACGRNNYTPPRNVAKFERDNALLPSLYASDGDYVLALNEIIQPLNSEIIPADIHIIYSKDLRNCRETIFPWGWNEALRIYLLRYGYPTDLLPTKKDVACWRELAHRRTAVKIAKLLGTEDTKMPIECFDMEGAEMVIRQKKEAMLKLPWSSSGRGVMKAFETDINKALKRADDSIRSQGSVIVETLLTKACDFATEWQSDGEDISFEGYSLFSTDAEGRYLGNIVDSQDKIVDTIAHYSDIGMVKSMLLRLYPILKQILIDEAEHPYIGPFGVDALATTDGRIVPCIEVNLRMTMGHAAIKIFNRLGEHHILKVSR